MSTLPALPVLGMLGRALQLLMSEAAMLRPVTVHRITDHHYIVPGTEVVQYRSPIDDKNVVSVRAGAWALLEFIKEELGLDWCGQCGAMHSVAPESWLISQGHVTREIRQIPGAARALLYERIRAAVAETFPD